MNNVHWTCYFCVIQTSYEISYFFLNDAIFYRCLTNSYLCDLLSMFVRNVKHRANDASNDGHHPPLVTTANSNSDLAELSYFDEPFITMKHSKTSNLRCIVRHVWLSTLEIFNLIRGSVVEQGAVAPHQSHRQLLEQPLHLHRLILPQLSRFGTAEFL